MDKTMNTLEDVLEFTRTFGHTENTVPVIPSQEIVSMRIGLMLEELTELMVASLDADNLLDIIDKFKSQVVSKCSNVYAVVNDTVANRTEVLDALVDIQYILNGTIIAFGMQDEFPDAWKLVHDNNMAKSVPADDTETINLTLDYYRGSSIKAGQRLINNRVVFYVVKDISNQLPVGKILKPYGFKPVKLKCS